MVTSELTGEVSMGVLLVFLVSWRWGHYSGSDQQGDTQLLLFYHMSSYITFMVQKKDSDSNDTLTTN